MHGILSWQFSWAVTIDTDSSALSPGVQGIATGKQSQPQHSQQGRLNVSPRLAGELCTWVHKGHKAPTAPSSRCEHWGLSHRNPMRLEKLLTWRLFLFKLVIGALVAFYVKNSCFFDFCTWQGFFSLKKKKRLQNPFVFHSLCTALSSPRPGKKWLIWRLVNYSCIEGNLYAYSNLPKVAYLWARVAWSGGEHLSAL